MDFTNNSYLTTEEKILLESLEETNTDNALSELEKFLMFVPTDNDSYNIAISLREKLINYHINIEQELEYLPDDDEITD